MSLTVYFGFNALIYKWSFWHLHSKPLLITTWWFLHFNSTILKLLTMVSRLGRCYTSRTGCFSVTTDIIIPNFSPIYFGIWISDFKQYYITIPCEKKKIPLYVTRCKITILSWHWLALTLHFLNLRRKWWWDIRIAINLFVSVCVCICIIYRWMIFMAPVGF